MRRFTIAFYSLFALSSALAVPLVNHGDQWRYRKGSSAPPVNWKTLADAGLDATWLTGPGGFGYGDSDDATVLSDMQNAYRTVYIRKTFTTDGSLPAADHLRLVVDYDDGFVAWLDGVELTRRNSPGVVGGEPLNTEGPSTTHEAGAAAVETIDLGAIGSRLGAGNHVLAILGMNESLGSSDFSLIADLSTFTPPPPADLHWELAESPITLTATLVIAANEELIIDPGVEVRCHGGSAAINCAGKITAMGTAAQRIRFVRANAATGWQQIRMTGTPECNFAYCDFDGSSTSGTIRGAGTASVSPSINLTNCRWLNTEVQMVELTYTSCNIINCEFDSIGAQELIHFSSMPATGHALIKGCRFGLPGVPPTSGYNDIVDFTGGNRPGPIARFIDNIFLSSVDDCFDMDATDAHIEGNLFLNVLQGAQRDSSSNPITTGEGSAVSELVICRNYFYNCEHLLLLKDSGAAVVQNNSFLRMVSNPNARNAAGTAIPPGIILFGEPWRGRPLGAGAIYNGNIAWDLDPIIQATPFPLYSGTTSFLVADHSLIQGNQWPGTGNITADPMFVSTTGIDYTNIRNSLALQTGSPARGAGPNGIDMGANVPAGASISGEPPAITSDRNATLTVGGPGIWVYKWRLNGAAWSADVPLVPASVLNGGIFTATMYDNPTPITLTNLPDGTYTVEVLGKSSGGDWQETPVASKTWTVQTTGPDTDGDQMPDAWEQANGLADNDPTDAAKDKDGDGASNLDEFIAGTDPQLAGSVFRATADVTAPGGPAIHFTAASGKSYQVQRSVTLAGGSWTPVQTIPAGVGGPQVVTDPTANSMTRAFYRVVTPAP